MRSWRRFLFIAGLIGVLVLTNRFGGRALDHYRNRDLIGQAKRAAQAHDDRAALEQVDLLLQRDPDSAEGLVLKASIEARHGRWGDVLATTNRISRDTRLPEQAEALIAEAHWQRGEVRDAESILLLRHFNRPANAEVIERLVEIFAIELRAIELRRVLLNLIPIRPLARDELLLFISGGESWGPVVERRRRLKQWIDSDPMNDESAIALAKLELRNGNALGVRAVLEPYLAGHVHDRRIQGLLAEAALELGDIDKAATILAESATDAPLELWLARGRFAMQTAEWEEANHCFTSALQLDPNDLTARLRLARSLHALGRVGEGAAVSTSSQLCEAIQRRSRLLSTKGLLARDETLRLLNELADDLLALNRPFESALVLEQLQQLGEASISVQQKLAQAKTLAQITPLALGVPPTEVGDYHPTHPTRLPADTRAVSDGDANAIRFSDRHAEVGIDFWRSSGDSGFAYSVEGIGGGVACVDFDLDGWPDIYFPQGKPLTPDSPRPIPSDQLFRNLDGTRFENVTVAAGVQDELYDSSAIAADLDNDGFPELVVGGLDGFRLLSNHGDGTFADGAAFAEIDPGSMTTSLACADVDRDGDLDLFAAGHSLQLRLSWGKDERPMRCPPGLVAPTATRLLLNRGDGGFVDATAESGLARSLGLGMGILAADLDGNANIDVVVTHEGQPNSHLAMLAGDTGNLRQVEIADMGSASSIAVGPHGTNIVSAGIARCDFDGDGHLDLFLAGTGPRSGRFVKRSQSGWFVDYLPQMRNSDGTTSSVGFGAVPLDADLDGVEELFVSTGTIDGLDGGNAPALSMPRLLRRLADSSASDAAAEAGAYFSAPQSGRGASRLDWDRDGRPDLVVVHQDRAAALLHNDTEPKNRIEIELVGTSSPRDAAGAILTVATTSCTTVIDCSVSNYLSCSEASWIVGTGNENGAATITVKWASGSTESWRGVAANSRVMLVEGRPEAIRR